MLLIVSVLFFGAVTTALPGFPPSWAPGGPPKQQNNWNLKQFNSLVTFGDSYTDESRLGYFISHNGAAPPPGTLLNQSFSTPGGGRTWDRYVIQYTGATINSQWVPAMTLYDYAVSGAVCSNEITPRYLAVLNGNFPSVLEYEIPAFIADGKVNNIATGKPYFSPALTANEAVYAIWIGTNDVGNNAFITDSQVPGKTLTDYINCVYASMDQLYATGARYFVLMNLAPLWLAPMYASAMPVNYWPVKPANFTEVTQKMKEYVTTVNSVYQFETPFDVLIKNRWPGANVANFDIGSFMTTMIENPTQYLNGTAPANVTGFEYQCDPSGSPCHSLGSPDSFFWYDSLHPSEQADRNIAKEFVKVISGDSTYASYYSSPAFSGFPGHGWN